MLGLDHQQYHPRLCLWLVLRSVFRDEFHHSCARFVEVLAADSDSDSRGLEVVRPFGV